ncbi:hypothetical protein PULV_a6002 [Pseudoalteromonas ulvae UL12]|nr:hypothetical protein [Pseudoalteromonas ulvae UL12]
MPLLNTAFPSMTLLHVLPVALIQMHFISVL